MLMKHKKGSSAGAAGHDRGPGPRATRAAASRDGGGGKRGPSSRRHNRPAATAASSASLPRSFGRARRPRRPLPAQHPLACSCPPNQRVAATSPDATGAKAAAPPRRRHKLAPVTLLAPAERRSCLWLQNGVSGARESSQRAAERAVACLSAPPASARSAHEPDVKWREGGTCSMLEQPAPAEGFTRCDGLLAPPSG